MKTLIRLSASGFFTGYSPIAPGTVGSLWGIVIYLLLYRYPSMFVLATLILYFVGFSISGKAEQLFKEKDSAKIVIDEIASMCLVFMFIKPDWIMVAAGFIFFRFFDIIKPPPARIMEKFSGSRGVMLDDVVAAFYAIIVVFALSRLQAAGILPMLNIQGPAA